jgi:hypothetical protein
MVSPAARILVVHVAAQSPELKALLEEHLDDNFGELLPHLYFGDVTRRFEDLWKVRIGPSASVELRGILEQLEQGLVLEDDYVQNLIAVSFIEDLQDLWHDPEFEAMLGPRMKHEYTTMRDWDDTHGRSS